MSTLHFTDGVRFNLTGPLRIERRHDGYYLVGKNMLVPLTSYQEGLDLIAEDQARRQP